LEILQKINQHRIILGSRSPRRQNLLKELGIQFEVIIGDDLHENYPPDLIKEEIPVFLAKQKSNQYLKYLDSNTILITADTIVWIDNEILGKPADHEDAVKILNRLSGRAHQVLTGVCIKSGYKERVFCVSSDVYFRKLDQEEIQYYISSYKPFDKAGAYGIQEWIGYIGIDKIEGSYFNVMGLPTQRLYMELIRFIQ
jgi:septum formation protein